MQVIAFSRPGTDNELQPFDRLAATMSSQFARLHVEQIGSAVAGTLEQIGRAIDLDACALIEFTAGAIGAVHSWPTAVATFGDSGCPPRWLTDRLAQREVVPVPDLEGPRDSGGETADQTGEPCGLAVPVVVADHVVCALVIWARRSSRPWPEPLVEGVRLIAEILGVSLQRCRQETALRVSVATIERLNARLAADNVYLQEEIKTHHDFGDIVGEGSSLQQALVRLGQVAPTNSSVLLLGETGTGKELFARAIHSRSRRRTRALVRVNCAALPPTLVESELFGHEKGSFTGAVSMRQGRFEMADGGTIFLDEIGDLQPDIQAKLLRVLQEGEFERVGSSRTQRADVRVIAATHRDLEAEVAAGRFRADLYYRLSVYPICLPALRERSEDIPSLVWFFIQRLQRELGRRITKVPMTVMSALQQHTWPGNVRELQNVVERAMIQSTGDTLTMEETFASAKRQPPDVTLPTSDTLDAIQRAHIETILSECGWRISGRRNGAERLGLHPNTLRFRMKKLGIVCPDRQARLHSSQG